MDDIFCLFQGRIENFAPLKQQYGLSKTGNEVNVVIEAYRSLRDRGPYPIEHVIRDLHGKFAFVLYDSASKNSFIAVVSIIYDKCPPNVIIYFLGTCVMGVWMQDPDGDVPFFWGADSEGHLVVSDDAEIVKKGCGKSYAPFPKGELFSMFFFRKS